MELARGHIRCMAMTGAAKGKGLPPLFPDAEKHNSASSFFFRRAPSLPLSLDPTAHFF
jgi:hypothetical protein